MNELLPADAAAHGAPSYVQEVVEFLTVEGFRPFIDEDGDVLFKFEGSTYGVLVGHGDPSFLNLMYLPFWTLDDAAERARAQEAAAYVQAG